MTFLLKSQVMNNGYRLLNIVASQLLIKVKIRLTRLSPRATLRFRFTALRSGHITRDIRFGARLAPLPNFAPCSRKTSYSPDVVQNPPLRSEFYTTPRGARCCTLTSATLRTSHNSSYTTCHKSTPPGFTLRHIA